MTFIEVRNSVINGLEEYLGRPVILSDQIANAPEFPYSYYSILTPRISTHSFGLQCVEEKDNGEYILKRQEPVKATLSFTFCSKNRELEDGSYIFGEDEAVELAEKAHGFFLLVAHNIQTENGDIVIDKVGTVSKRSSFVVEETVRRYGFDVQLSYIRTDEMPASVIQNVGAPIGAAHS